MSNEFESQVKESIFNDKLLNFYKKFKFYIIFFFFLIILIPIIYQFISYRNNKKNMNYLEVYSYAISDLRNKDFNKSINTFEKLALSDNNTIALLSFYQLYELNKNSKSQLIKLIDRILNKKKLVKENIELLKLKKSLIIFDNATEDEMLKTLDIKRNNNLFYEINLKIMYDFYVARNENNKAIELKKIIDGK